MTPSECLQVDVIAACEHVVLGSNLPGDRLPRSVSLIVSLCDLWVAEYDSSCFIGFLVGCKAMRFALGQPGI